MAMKNQGDRTPGRRYPPFWEKGVPFLVAAVVVVVAVLLIIAIAVVLGVLPAQA